jgi:hypothetical protein
MHLIRILRDYRAFLHRNKTPARGERAGAESAERRVLLADHAGAEEAQHIIDRIRDRIGAASSEE